MMIWQKLSEWQTWTQLGWTLLNVIIIIVAGKLLLRVVRKALHHVMIEREQAPLRMDTRRTKTIGKLMDNITSYAVHFIMVLMILNQFGIKLEPLLAGAGVVGLAIGFGAQSLVKDVITGFFIIFEDQFAVGDVIQTGTFKGTVEQIGLRVTRIKSYTGEVFIIPNGTITQVTNFSVYNSLAIIDVSVASEQDLDEAIRVFRETVTAAYPANPNVAKEPEVLGVQTLGANKATLRAIAECVPNMNPVVVRDILADVKKAFHEHGIAMPVPKLVHMQPEERQVAGREGGV